MIVETDGFEHHDTRAAFERDRARDAHLTACGWRVLRFTAAQLDGDAAAVAAVLRAVVVLAAAERSHRA